MTTFSSELSGSLIFSSGSQVQARINPASASLNITGALHISGSDLTVDGVSVLDRLSNLESGGVSDSASLGPLNRATASLQTFTQSIQAEVDAIKVTTGSLTSSVETLTSQVSSLINVTASYLTTASTYYSESAQISASGYLTSASAAALGFGSGGSTIPAGTISGSAQIEDLGFITASATASYVDGANVDGSVTSSLSASVATTAQTASFISDTFISASAVRSGFGSGGSTPAGTISGSTQIEELGFITSSDSTSTGSLLQTASVSSNTITFTKGDSTTFDITVATGSGGGGGDVTYDGNRIISQDKLPSLFSASFNPGTSGSIQEFLNAVFYPNSAPTINTGNQTIVEFTPSGSSIVTVTGTDPEGQSLTFGTSSAYTDDFVRV